MSSGPTPGGRLRAGRGLLALGLAGLAIGVLGATSAPRDSVIPGVEGKIYRGYVPYVDPESASVSIGRRLNAPLVSKRFTGGARSLDDLGRTVCRALRRQDRDSLIALCIRDDEFRDILWREFPQSRPATGTTWEDAWRILLVRLLSGCSEAIHDHGGSPLEFMRFEVDSFMAYKNFKMHSRIQLVARDDQGRVLRMRWLRTIVERKGSFKIYSTDD